MSHIELIERKLGRKLDSKLRGSLANLNEIPDSWLKDAAALKNPLLVEELLRYLTRSECHPFLQSFIQDVVFGGVPAQIWRRGRVLVPSLSLADQLTRDRSSLLKPIGGEFHVRIVPDLQDWQAGVAWVGAPAKSEPAADYRSPEAEGAASLAAAHTEPVADPAVALRRWIAARLANTLRASGRLDAVRDLPELTVGLPPMDRWSDDARIAARALLSELREPGYAAHTIPGFRGPDSWYKGTDSLR